MKKANFWIVGLFLLIALINYVDAAMLTDGPLLYAGEVHFAAFVLSLFLTRKSKSCNLFYLIYSSVLCVAVVIFLMPFVVPNIVWFLAFLLIDPFISLVVYVGAGTHPLQILGTVLLFLFPFIAMCISFCFYTKNKCEQKEPGSV